MAKGTGARRALGFLHVSRPLQSLALFRLQEVEVVGLMIEGTVGFFEMVGLMVGQRASRRQAAQKP
jgi:hypothetical protein